MKLRVDVEVGDMGAGKDSDGPSKPFVVKLCLTL